MKKRILSALLVVALFLTAFANVSAANRNSFENFQKQAAYTAGQFADVAPGAWYEDNVQSAYELGLMIGTSDVRFDPEGNLSIAQAVTIAARLHSVYFGNEEAFASSTPWYQTYMDYANFHRMIALDDYPDPELLATRAQYASILNAAFPDEALAPINVVSALPDVARDADYAPAVLRLYRAGILKGNDASGTFAPDRSISRAEVAAMVTRMADPDLRLHFTLAGQETGTPVTITFDWNYRTAESQTVEVPIGQPVPEPTPPTRTLFKFDGWYTSTSGWTKYDFSAPVYEDITLYAHWSTVVKDKGKEPEPLPSSEPSEEPVFYNVSFDTGVIDIKIDTQKIHPGELASEPDIPARDGYTFLGWYSDNIFSVPFDFSSEITSNITLYANWLTAMDTTDSDGDGLLDIYEHDYGTDVHLADTDGDGLSDYEELLMGTDPLKADITPDDSDGDGISDIDEIRIYNTDPTFADTDGDGLSDYDEIFTYHTDPNSADTDVDGLDDAFEIEHSLDPNNASSNSSIADNELKFQQVTDDSCVSSDLSASDNTAIPSIYGLTTGQLSKNVYMASNTDVATSNDRAIVGKAVLIEAEDQYVSGLTLNFDCDSFLNAGGSTQHLVICKLNDDGEYILADTERKSNSVSCTLDSSGTYFVLDLDLFLDGLGIDLSQYNSTPNLELMSSNSNATDVIRLMSVPFATLFADNPVADISGQADIVFVIDTTGSMSDEIKSVVNNVTNFAESLSKEYNVVANYALIEYRDLEEDGLDTTKSIKNGASNWFNDVSDFAQHVNELYADGGGDDPECAVDALEMARNLNFRVTANKFIILITDADYKVLNNYGISSMQEEIELLRSDGIIVSVVTSNDLRGTYQSLVETTGGTFANISDSFSSVLLELAGSVGEETADGTWVILKHGYRYVKLPEDSNGDCDGDGLSDVYELGRKETIDLSLLVKTRLALSGIPFDQYFGKTSIEVYNAVSDPTTDDTDGDGILDNRDTAPWAKGLANGIIGNLYLVTCYGDGFASGHSYFVYQSYVKDSIDFSGLVNGWKRKDPTISWTYANLQRDIPSTSSYQISPGEYVSIGNGALGGGPSGGMSDGSSDGSVAGDANGVNYNMEAYKFIAAGRPTGAGVAFSYLSNTYITEEITEATLRKLVSYLSRDDVNYWSLMHNCAKVAQDGWNYVSSTQVSAYGLYGWHIAPTPSALRDNLRKISGCAEDFQMTSAFPS